MTAAPSTPSSPTSPARPQYRWRTVDIVVTAVVGAAFGVVFWAWNLLWAATGPAFTAFPPLQGFMYGVWLVPAVLTPLIIRKPGAGLLGEGVAALVSVLLGSASGLMIVVYGLLQGLAGDAGYAVFRYRRWNTPPVLLSAALAGLTAVVLDIALYYYAWAFGWILVYAALVVASTVVIAGTGSMLLVSGLARAGALSAFPSGRRSATS